jgi:hypothetical protein
LRQKIPSFFASVAGAESGKLPGLQENYLFRGLSGQRIGSGGQRRKEDYLHHM